MDNRKAVVAETPIYCKMKIKMHELVQMELTVNGNPAVITQCHHQPCLRPGDLINQICLFILTKKKTSSTGMPWIAASMKHTCLQRGARPSLLTLLLHLLINVDPSHELWLVCII